MLCSARAAAKHVLQSSQCAGRGPFIDVKRVTLAVSTRSLCVASSPKRPPRSRALRSRQQEEEEAQKSGKASSTNTVKLEHEASFSKTVTTTAAPTTASHTVQAQAQAQMPMAFEVPPPPGPPPNLASQNTARAVGVASSSEAKVESAASKSENLQAASPGTLTTHPDPQDPAVPTQGIPPAPARPSLQSTDSTSSSEVTSTPSFPGHNPATQQAGLGPVEINGSAAVASEQYDKLRHLMPLTNNPQLATPQPEDLKVGMQLRVQWSDAWWPATVKEEDGALLRIGFASWSAKYDEWIPRDSPRLKLPLPEDLKGMEKRSDQADLNIPNLPDNIHIPHRTRAFVPKPYNPEKEFRKRQLRMQAKIDAFRQQELAEGRTVPSMMADATAAPRFPLQAQSSTPHIQPEAGAESREAAAFATPPSVGTDTAAPSAAPTVAQGSEAAASVTPPSVGTETAAPSAAPTAAQGSEAAAFATPPSVGTDTAAPSAAPTAAQGSEAAPPDAADPVRWVECVSDKGERYYFEPSTGGTQWELPQEGWVELKADDGSCYYWMPQSGATQWTKPEA